MHELTPDCRFVGNQRTWCEGHDDPAPDPMAALPARSCNDPEHNARRADETYGTPCIACGAPIIRGEGHDEGCPLIDGEDEAGHRRNTPWCAECSGECLYDDEGRRVAAEEVRS